MRAADSKLIGGTSSKYRSGLSMRARLGWRHLLPILQTFLYCALVWWGFRERYPSTVSTWEPPSEYVLVQEGAVHWDPRYIDGPPPRGFRIGWALNLPALVPALLILLPARILFRDLASLTSDVLTVVSIGIFVPVIWYGVGWWIDNRRGRFPPKLFALPILRQKILVALALLMSLPTLVLGIIFFISGLALGETWRHAEIVGGMLGWSAWLCWISLAQVKRFRRLANNPLRE